MIDPTVIQMVTERAQGYCEVCGKVETPSMAFHHRKLKSRGGKNTVSNLIRVHHGCHNLDTNSIHSNPNASQDYGYMVASWQDPEEVPMLCPDETWVILNNNGSLMKLGEGNGTDNGKR